MQDPFVSLIMLYLGFFINTREMTVTWPHAKRIELRDLILDVFQVKPKHTASPRVIASIIGKIRSAARIAPLGNFMYFSCQEALTAALRKSSKQSKWVWHQGKMRIPAKCARDLPVLVEFLTLPDFHPTWTRPIALLIPRTGTHSFLSDASYCGLGGWSPEFAIMWCIMRDDLLQFGCPMKAIETAGEPADLLQEGLHINPLEFIAIILNLWLALKLIDECSSLASGYIVTHLSDNTIAISWMRAAGRCHDEGVHRLARLTAALLVRANLMTTPFQTRHIPGIQKDEADCLSRLVNRSVPSWAYVTMQCSRLAICQLCLPPPALLFTLARIHLSPLTEGTYKDVTTQLLTHAFVILPPSSRPPGGL